MRINENSPRKWPKTHSQRLFLRINENSPRKWPKTHSQKLFISLFRIMSSVKKERDIAVEEKRSDKKYAMVAMGLKFVGIANFFNCIAQQVNNN